MNEVRRKTLPIARIRMSDYNPRKMSAKALAALTKSIEEFGLVQELVVNHKEDGTYVLVSGHQRVKILKSKGEKEVPVAIVKLDDKREKALNLSMNNQLLAGEFTEDLDKLLHEIQKGAPALYRNLRMDTLESKEKKSRPRGGAIEFSQELMESHNCIVLYWDNEIDWLQLQTLYSLPRVKALDSKEGFEKIGIARVIKGAEFIRKIQESKP